MDAPHTGQRPHLNALMRPIVVGIDISDRSIEIVSLLQRKGRLTVAQAGRRELSAGIIERGVIQEPDALVRSLSGALDAIFGAKRGRVQVGAALPSSVTYAKTFTVPATFERDMLRKAVALEAADSFPIAMQDVVDDVIVTPQQGGAQQDVLYVAALKDVAKAYRSAFARAGCQLLWLDSEDLALARGLGAARPPEPMLVVDVGNRTTLIALVDRNGLRMSANIPFGAAKLKAALEQKLKVTFAEADKIMRRDGFDPSVGDSRTFFVLQQPTEELVYELRKTFVYAEKRFGVKVRGMILAGGTSLIPGIADYLASNFQDIAVGLGDPVRGIDVEKGTELADTKKALLYATAVGLATRAVGARASPEINLLPDVRQEGAGPLASVRRIFSAITSSLTMVTHAKKSHPRKKKSDAEAHAAKAAAQPEPEAPPMQEAPAAPEAAPKESAPVAAKAADVMDMTPPELLATESAEEEAPAEAAEEDAIADAVMGTPAASVEDVVESGAEAETPKAAAEEPAEEPDFGLGIGDILRDEEEIKSKKIDLDDDGPVSDEGKLSIEDILNRGDADDGRPAKKPAKRPVAASGEGSGKAKVIALVLLVLICFGAAAAGVYAFVKKNGFPAMPFAGTKPAPAQPAPSGEAPVATAPGQAPTSVNVTVMLATAQKPSGDKPLLVSRIVETDVKASDSFPTTGMTATAAGKSSGKATIINTTSRSYTFVATTRLLSKDGVLFRMKTASPIPANGSVTVEVAADQPGPEGDIGPTTFTIPGLPPDLQKLITAKSDAAMTGGAGQAKAVSAADIATAKAKLEERLKKEALDNFGVMLAEGERLEADLVTSKELAATWPKVGTVGSTFNAMLSLRFRALLIPEKAAAVLLDKALKDALPSGLNAVDYALGTPLYAVQAYDTAAEVAEIRLEAPVIGRQ